MFSLTDVAQGPAPKKQKQKIVALQKKLDAAEKEQRKAELEVDRLSTEIHKAQLNLVRKQVDEWEKLIRQGKPIHPDSFSPERELLHRMIQDGPSPSSFDAQIELDRVLRLITELSDDEARP
jgi:hypothetical protein